MALIGKVISGHFDHSYLEWSKLFLAIPNKRNCQMDEIGKMSVWLKWFWHFQMDEIDTMGVCLQYIWNENR